MFTIELIKYFKVKEDWENYLMIVLTYSSGIVMNDILIGLTISSVATYSVLDNFAWQKLWSNTP